MRVWVLNSQSQSKKECQYFWQGICLSASSVINYCSELSGGILNLNSSKLVSDLST